MESQINDLLFSAGGLNAHLAIIKLGNRTLFDPLLAVLALAREVSPFVTSERTFFHLVEKIGCKLLRYKL